LPNLRGCQLRGVSTAALGLEAKADFGSREGTLNHGTGSIQVVSQPLLGDPAIFHPGLALSHQGPNRCVVDAALDDRSEILVPTPPACGAGWHALVGSEHALNAGVRAPQNSARDISSHRSCGLRDGLCARNVSCNGPASLLQIVNNGIGQVGEDLPVLELWETGRTPGQNVSREHPDLRPH